MEVPFIKWAEFLGVCFPPKPFNWEKASQRVFWQWGCDSTATQSGAYPTNADIDDVNQTPFGSNNKTNILLFAGWGVPMGTTGTQLSSQDSPTSLIELLRTLTRVT